MLRKKSYVITEYLVYIIYDRNKNIFIKITDNGRKVFSEQSKDSSKLVYFEKFSEKSKALRKKRYLKSLSDIERKKLIKKKNPDMLNLIFTIYNNEILLTKV